MIYVVGLGNPGAEYRQTRHNCGYRVIARLAEEMGVRLRAGRGDYMSGRGPSPRTPLTLVLPLTYMNASGTAVMEALSETGGLASELLVVCDDVNLDLGQLRIRRSGSDGGHNGLASIIRSLGTTKFPRLRMGVGREPAGVDMADYVLEAFGPDETEEAEKMVTRASEAVRHIVARGIGNAMTIYNQWESPQGPTES